MNAQTPELKIDVKAEVITIPVVSVNIADIKNNLGVMLARYDLVVTEDSVKDSKRDIAEIRKIKKTISSAHAELKKQILAPLEEIVPEIKSLISMCDSAVKKIDDQVKEHEEDTLNICRMLLEKMLSDLRKSDDITPEFAVSKIDDLVLLGSITPARKLTAKAKSVVEARVRQEKAIVDRTEKRLLILENKSFKAGLHTALTLDHVAHFLQSDDDTYEENLDRMIRGELDRESTAAQVAAENLAKASQKAFVEPPAIEIPEPVVVRVTVPVTAPEVASAPETPSPTGKYKAKVTLTFSLEVSERVTLTQLEDEARRVTTKAGFKSVQSVLAERV